MLLSMMDKAKRHKATFGNPQAMVEQAQADALHNQGKRQFLDRHIKSREESRHGADVLRGSGFGQFFDALDTKEAEAAYDGKNLSVGPIMDETFTGARNRGRGRGALDILSRGGVAQRPAAGAPVGNGEMRNGVSVHGPRRNPDLATYAPADFQDMRLGGGVSSRGERGGSPALAARPQDPELAASWNNVDSTNNLMEEIRGRRVDSQRRDALDVAETKAAEQFVPSAVKARGEQSAVAETLARIRAAADVEKAKAAAAGVRDAATIRGQRAPAEPLDYADTFGKIFGSKKNAPQPGTPERQLYDWLIQQTQGAGGGRAGGPGGFDDDVDMLGADDGDLGSPELNALADQIADQHPTWTDEQIAAELVRRSGGL